MKKKGLLLLLIPILLTSCGKNGVPFATIKAITDELEDTKVYPYYHVSGALDFNGMVTSVDHDFTNSPKTDTYVPYARYNEGFYNAAIDIYESNPANIVIYGMASKSYWLRAPMRITKENFYTMVPETSGNGRLNDISFIVNYFDTYADIGIIGEGITGAMATVVDDNTLRFEYTQDGEKIESVFTRLTEFDKSKFYDGTWSNDDGDMLSFTQGNRENHTCAHYLLRSIITSYAGQSGSVNPSSCYMTYEVLPNKHFVFVGNKVHTNVKIDNYPYYFDPELLGLEWDEDDPLPVYKSNVNAKVNIRIEYDENGWLVKESMTSLNYDYNVSSDAQISLIAQYTYKFSD